MVFFITHQPVISKYDDKYFIIQQNIMTILLVQKLKKEKINRYEESKPNVF